MKVTLKNLFFPVLIFMALSGVSYSEPGTLEPGKLVEKAYGDAFLALQKGTAEIEMEIKKGAIVENKTLLFKSKRGDDGLLKMMIKITKPLKKKGSSFLVIERKDDTPRQWSYVKAIDKVSEVAAGKAAGSFFGSTFMNADLVPQTGGENDANLKLLEDSKTEDGEDCHVAEINITREGSPYKKIIVNVSKSSKLPVKVTFFDDALKPLKEMKILETIMIGKTLTASKLEMKSLVNDHSTTIQIKNANPDARLEDSEFTQTAMKK